MAFAQPAMAEQPSTAAPAIPKSEVSSITSQRSLKQLGIFMGGAAFFGLSTLITRRALVRKYHAMNPKFFGSSNATPDVNGAVEAAEAFTLATLNVFSISTMVLGGTLWAFDISTMDEARAKLRAQMGIEVGEGGDAQSDREIEEWMVGVLAKKELKEMAKEMAKGPPEMLEKPAQEQVVLSPRGPQPGANGRWW